MSNDHEWLNLVEVSGPFLAVPVLKDVFPQGLEALSSGHPQRLRRTYEEWREAVDIQDVDLTELHAAWVKEVLSTALEIDDAVLRSGNTLPASLTMMMPEHGTTITPDLAVVNPTNADEPLLLIHVYAPDTNLEATHRFDGLAITPADRMVSLLRATGCPIGLVTNGERWMLVHAPVGAVAGFASWYARLWGQEPETLRAFVSLLGVRRSFGPDDGRLAALYERSLKHQDDVTEALGEQVRRAVEVLVQSLDRANQDRNQELLRDVDPRELYEASLTVMMRLVFLLAAEERGLLLLGDPRYDSFYAISSLRMQLRSDSEEILERSRSAWSRLLGLFRGVFGGIEHPTLRLPALGGSLFDPDRYPFLEGRKKGTFWRTDPAEPLPIDDRTVLLLLEAIQTFQGRALSYRALDVEQIGHVYEGLLERTVKRVDDVTLELDGGSKAKSPRITLGEMESARLDGTSRVVELIKERSERSEPAIQNALERQVDDRLAARLLTVCRGDVALRDRILPVANLLRTDPWGYPLVHHKGAFVVVLGADRRDSGTHYTPKSLTERIVEETLSPVAYRGPAEGKPPLEWELKSAEDLLDLKICDPAMGSGAFLVQACRWLSDRLVEAWSITEANGKRIDSEGRILHGEQVEASEFLASDIEERAILARRLIAERCLYGVDMNPLAVELAKLSLWLTTVAKGRPFGFLDHNLRSGDSLLGVHDLGQLIELDMNPKGSKQRRLFGNSIRSSVDQAIALRARLREIPIRDIHDVEAMAALDTESRAALKLPERIADALVGVVFAEDKVGTRRTRLENLAALADKAAGGDNEALGNLLREASQDLSKDAPNGRPRNPFHWPLEFPEVFMQNNGGFSAVVGNPPFLGGKKITTAFGERYRTMIVLNTTGGKKGAADLSAYFLLRANSLISNGGCAGLLGTDSIATGDTGEIGLKALTGGGSNLFFVISTQKWPGSAQVSISVICWQKGTWNGPRLLDAKEVKSISWSLTPDQDEDLSTKKLKKVICESFAGTYINGDGFILTSEEVHELVAKDGKNEKVIRRYLGGDDINTNFRQASSRYVVDFGIMSKEQAIKFPDCFEITTKKVKPYRDTLTKQIHETDYWKFWDKRIESYKKISKFQKVLVAARASKYIQLSFVNNGQVFSDQVVVFISSSFGVIGVLQSSIHSAWGWHCCTTMGQSTIRYAPSKAVATFPAPTISTELEEVGKRYFDARRNIEELAKIGLTELYNTVHDKGNLSKNLEEFRELHRENDLAVARAYGWEDLDLDHGFHDVPYLPENDRVRFTIAEPARIEVLRRLATLNRQRYEEEVAQGLHGKKKPAAKQHASKAARDQSALDLGDLPTFDLEP